MLKNMFRRKKISERLKEHFDEVDSLLGRWKSEFELRYYGKIFSKGRKKDFMFARIVGAGSFGKVVFGVHKANKKTYAMKLLEKKHLVKMKQVQHAIDEIRIMNAVNFDFLISLDYFFKDNVYIFIVMPYIQGGELLKYLKKEEKFEEEQTQFYAAQVILVFDYLHHLGIIHRDVKPENILMDLEGYIKVTDFGFCKKIDDQRTYTFCGTPEYLAPEIILSQGYNKSVDWWSLGVLIYEMSAGYPPFYARDPMKIYEKIVSGKYTTPPHFSRQLKDLLSNMLQVDRTKRYGILKNGSKDVKNHEWFKHTDFAQILNRKYKTTYKPQFVGEGDTSNFDQYEEMPLRTSSKNEFAEEFADLGD